MQIQRIAQDLLNLCLSPLRVQTYFLDDKNKLISTGSIELFFKESTNSTLEIDISAANPPPKIHLDDKELKRQEKPVNYQPTELGSLMKKTYKTDLKKLILETMQEYSYTGTLNDEGKIAHVHGLDWTTLRDIDLYINHVIRRNEFESLVDYLDDDYIDQILSKFRNLIINQKYPTFSHQSIFLNVVKQILSNNKEIPKVTLKKLIVKAPGSWKFGCSDEQRSDQSPQSLLDGTKLPLQPIQADNIVDGGGGRGPTPSSKRPAVDTRGFYRQSSDSSNNIEDLYLSLLSLSNP